MLIGMCKSQGREISNKCEINIFYWIMEKSRRMSRSGSRLVVDPGVFRLYLNSVNINK